MFAFARAWAPTEQCRSAPETIQVQAGTNTRTSIYMHIQTYTSQFPVRLQLGLASLIPKKAGPSPHLWAWGFHWNVFRVRHANETWERCIPGWPLQFHLAMEILDCCGRATIREMRSLQSGAGQPFGEAPAILNLRMPKWTCISTKVGATISNSQASMAVAPHVGERQDEELGGP